MSRLGDFGVDHGPLPEPDTFGFFGEEIRTNPAMTELGVADFLEVASSIDEGDARGAIAGLIETKRFARNCVHPDDFDKFWAKAQANRQDSEDLLGALMPITDAMLGGRPTGRSSVSTDGPQTTPGNSSPEPASLEERVLPRLVKAHPGRPDLQLAGLRTIEGRVAAAS